MFQIHDTRLHHPETHPAILRSGNTEQYPVAGGLLRRRYPPRGALPKVRQVPRDAVAAAQHRREEADAARHRGSQLQGGPDHDGDVAGLTKRQSVTCGIQKREHLKKRRRRGCAEARIAIS